ncbi:MAG: hypothetical protein LQ349_009478, partial [Xanthoria aureola]
VQSLIGQLHNHTEPSSLDEDSRLALLKAFKDMQYTLESSGETANRLHYAVRIPSSAMGYLAWTFAVAYIFKNDPAVARAQQSTRNLQSLPKELAEETNTDPVLLGIEKTSPNELISTQVSSAEFPFFLIELPHLPFTHRLPKTLRTLHQFAPQKPTKHRFESATAENPKTTPSL